MPASSDLHPDLSAREDLDPRQDECLVCYVDRLLGRGDCGGAFSLARWWRDLRAPRATGLEARLDRLGARCDCEVLSLVFERTASLEADAWERPTCGGVLRGSTQPCRRWQLRRRWAAAG